jgi:hypothetical protein
MTVKQALLSTKGSIFGVTAITLDGRKREFNGKLMDWSFDRLDEENGQVTILENNAGKHGQPRSFKLARVLEIRCGWRIQFPQNEARLESQAALQNALVTA